MNELIIRELIFPLIYTCLTLPSLFILFRFYLLNRKKEYHALLLLLAVFSFYLLSRVLSRVFAFYTDQLFLATQFSRLYEASLLILFVIVPYVLSSNYQLKPRWAKVNRFFFLIGIVTCVYMMFFAFAKPEVFLDVRSLFDDDFNPGPIPGVGAAGYLMSLRDILIILFFIYGLVIVIINRRDHVLNPVQSSIIIGVIIIFICSIGDLTRNITGNYELLQGVVRFVNFELGVTLFSLFVFSRTTIYILKRGILSESIQKSLEEKQRLLEHQATHRRETGLLNRSAFHDDVNRYFAEDEKPEGIDAQIFIYIDNYTDLYESFGSSKTEQIIKQICFRIQNVLVDNSKIYQTGSNEFVIFIRNSASVDYVKRFTEILRSLLLQRIPLSDDFYYITMRMGVLVLPRDGDNLEEVQKNSYNTLNNAAYTQNRILFYNESVGRQSTERFEIISLIQKSMNKREFHNIYKPVVDSSGQVTALEARINWDHSYASEQILNEAESSGIMNELGMFTLKLILDDIKTMRINGIFHKIFMQISPSQIISEGYGRNVINKIEASNLTIDDIGFELEDNPSFTRQSFFMENVQLMKNSGYDFILDNFGKDYNYISILHRLPISVLKLHRSVLTDIPGDERKTVYLKHILSMMNDLGFSILADGVDSGEVLPILKDNHVGLYLGDLFYKAMTLQEILDSDIQS